MAPMKLCNAIFLLGFGAPSVFATTFTQPCPYPKEALEQCLSGAATIEIVVTSPGKFTAQVLDVAPELFRSTAACVATHAGYFFPKKTEVSGRYTMPLTFNIATEFSQCSHQSSGP